MSRGALLFLVVVLLLLLGGPAVVDRVVNGARVGPRTTVGDDGIVADDPSELAGAADLELDVYSLARALASEHGSDPDPYLRAVGWAIRNKAAEKGVTIFRLVTDGRGTAGDGRFGAQNAGAGSKYVSTRQDPAARHVKIAAQVTQSFGNADPTGGATHFYSPNAQDALAARAAEGYRKDAAALAASWAAPGGLYPEGAEPVVPAGIDGRVLTLFRRLG